MDAIALHGSDCPGWRNLDGAGCKLWTNQCEDSEEGSWGDGRGSDDEYIPDEVEDARQAQDDQADDDDDEWLDDGPYIDWASSDEDDCDRIGFPDGRVMTEEEATEAVHDDTAAHRALENHDVVHLPPISVLESYELEMHFENMCSGFAARAKACLERAIRDDTWCFTPAT
eukprot:COSAG02_NODE_3841_length_6167_cov_50.360997_4_plen_171_part_00